MPYIDPSARRWLDADGEPRDPGELNYAITQHLLNTSEDMLEMAVEHEVQRYLAFKRTKRDNRYSDFNDVLGALDAARREYERRRGGDGRLVILEWVAKDLYSSTIAPYEDIKIKQNGDIYL
jgi:hypothetical protein